MTLALEAIKIVDLSRLTPGPYGSMLLADMGADVIMVEEAGRAAGRRGGQVHKTPASSLRGDASPEGRRRAAAYALGRNKRSIRLNLKTEEGRAIFYRLSDAADVVLEGYRPGVTQRLGVDYQTLSARNPRLVYCSLSGYGQDGPYAQLVGHDVNYISIAGALGMIGRKGTPPAIPMNTIADYAGGGLMAAFSICVALLAREQTGQGQYIDTAMSDGVMSLLSGLAGTHFNTGENLAPETSRFNGGVPNYDVYETADGKWLSIGANEPWFFADLCRELGREELAEHQWSEDPDERREIAEFLRASFKRKTRDEWFRDLAAIDVCVAPVYTLAEASADPHNLHRRMVVDVEAAGVGPVKQIGIAPKLSETPGEIRHSAPYPGEQTDAILREHGIDEATIADYRAREVVA